MSESAGKYISAIYRHLQILIAKQLEPYRIGSGQYIFMLTIASREGISQKMLSQELLIDKTTTAKAISKLEAEGYVRREVSAEDQRCNLLYLTESGREILPNIREKLNLVEAIYNKDISDEEYELFLSLLKRMLYNVCSEVHKGGYTS